MKKSAKVAISLIAIILVILIAAVWVWFAFFSSPNFFKGATQVQSGKELSEGKEVTFNNLISSEMSIYDSRKLNDDYVSIIHSNESPRREGVYSLKTGTAIVSMGQFTGFTFASYGENAFIKAYKESTKTYHLLSLFDGEDFYSADSNFSVAVLQTPVLLKDGTLDTNITTIIDGNYYFVHSLKNKTTIFNNLSPSNGDIDLPVSAQLPLSPMAAILDESVRDWSVSSSLINTSYKFYDENGKLRSELPLSDMEELLPSSVSSLNLRIYGHTLYSYNKIALPKDAEKYDFLDTTGNKFNIKEMYFNIKTGRMIKQTPKYVPNSVSYDHIGDKMYLKVSAFKIIDQQQMGLPHTIFVKQNGIIAKEYVTITTDFSLSEVVKLKNDLFYSQELGSVFDRKGNEKFNYTASNMSGTENQVSFKGASAKFITVQFTKSKLYGAIDFDGKQVIKPEYNNELFFFGEYAIGKKIEDGITKYYSVGESGVQLMGEDYEDFSQYGFAIATDVNKTTRFVNTKNQTIFTIESSSTTQAVQLANSVLVIVNNNKVIHLT